MSRPVFLTAEQVAQAEVWRDAGWSLSRIASRFGVSEPVLRKHVEPLPSHRTRAAAERRGERSCAAPPAGNSR